MKINNKYDELYVLIEKDIYKVYVEEIDVNIDSSWTNIDYQVLVEMQNWLITISTEWDVFREDELYSSLKDAKKALNDILNEEEKIEERRKLYKELKEEFEGYEIEEDDLDDIWH